MKHYDNKNDIIRQMRKAQHAEKHTENCVNATYNAYMMVACLVLYEKCKFREKRLTTFVNEFYGMVEAYQNGEITYESMKKRLSDYGIEFEPLHVQI